MDFTNIALQSLNFELMFDRRGSMGMFQRGQEQEMVLKSYESVLCCMSIDV
jgi:hypothetical protein